MIAKQEKQTKAYSQKFYDNLERDDEDYSMHEIELETERDYRRNSIIEEEKELDENQYSSSSSSEGIEIESQSIVSLGDNKE